MKVSSYVVSARTLSLVIIVLGYVGWDLGTRHSERATLLTKAKGLVTQNWLRREFRNDRKLVDHMIEKGAVTLDPGTGILSQKSATTIQSPVGEVKINLRTRSLVGRFGKGRKLPGITLHSFSDFRGKFDGSVKGPFGEWNIAIFSLNTGTAEQRLADIAFDLDIEIFDDPAKTIDAIKEELYHRKISVPSVEFASFRSETATWVIALVCFLSLIVLRSRVRLIALDPDAGLDAPWLILDAHSLLEKSVACLWLAGILLSSWVVNGALALTEQDLIAAGNDAGWIASLAMFAAVAGLATASGWAALATVTDLLRLRAIRKDRHAQPA